MSDNLRRWLPWIAVAAVALIVIVIIAVNNSGDDEEAATTTTTEDGGEETTTTTEAETTTTTEGETTTTAAARPPGEALKLASLLPLTGDLAAFGPGMENSVKMAVEEANAAGGVQGSTITLESFDTATSADVAPAEADKIIAGGFQGEVGAASSGISLSVIDALTAAEVIMVSPSNTSPQFTAYPHGGYYYRTAPSDTLQGEFTAQLLANSGADNLAIIYRADSYGEGLNEVVAASYTGTIVAQEPYDAENLDAKTLITTIAAAEPASVLCICFPETGVQIHVEAVSQGLLLEDQSLPWFYTDGMLDPTFVQALTDAGVENAAALLANFTGTAPGSEETDAAAQFAAAYQDAYGEEFTLFAPQSYDAAWLMILAAEASDGSKIGIKGQMVAVSKGGESCIAAECLALLQADPTTDIDYLGASGEIDFKENQSGDPGSAAFQIWEFTADGGTNQLALMSNPSEVPGG